MTEYSATNILTSMTQGMHEPKQSNYVKKLMGSFRKHIRGRQYANILNPDTPPVEVDSKQIPNKIDSTKNYEKNQENQCGQVSSLEEEETAKKCKKNVSFSPKKEFVEIDVDQPNYEYITPLRVVVHLYETPQPQKPVYKCLTNLTPVLKTEKFTEDVPKSSNLICNHPCKQDYAVDLSTTESNNFVRSPSGRSVDDKFVVNLSENRQSTRWKRKAVYFPADDITPQWFVDQQMQYIYGQDTESQKMAFPKPSQEQTLDANEMFQKLKKARDVECVRMVQASNVLKVIKRNPRNEWSDELLAQKLLLETEEKCSLLISKIRGLGYTELKTPKPCHKATATLSNFEFFLKPQEVRDYKPSKYTQFFILTLSHDTEVLMSKVMVPRYNKIIFEEKFTFANLNSDFNITAKLFRINLKTRRNMTLCSYLRKKTNGFCPMSTIYYENLNNFEWRESSVLKTSFSCCGQFTLTKNQLGSSDFTISQISSYVPLQKVGNFSFQNDSLTILSNLKGFLTLVVPSKGNEILLRKRKWCVLDGTILSIYNYPSEEDFGNPIFSVNLQNCLVPSQANLKNWCGKKTFFLKAGEPSISSSVERFFFTADDEGEFQLWRNQIQSILNCLGDWQRLVFQDD